MIIRIPRVSIVFVMSAALLSQSLAGDAIRVIEQSNDRIHRFVMDNGMVGLVKPDSSAPVAAIQVWVGTGSIHEDDYLGAGLSHYVEHMFFKGTPTRTTGQITREINDAGGSVNAYTSLDRTVYHTVIPAANWTVALDVFSDALMNAAFPEDEWEREQNVILQEMEMGRDSPQRQLNRILWSTAFRVHPYRHPIIGYEEVFLQTDRNDLIEFHNRHYVPDNMIFAMVGDVDPHDAEQRIRAAFSDFSRRARAPVIIPQEPPQVSERQARKTGDYEVSRISIGWHTVPISHPDAAALDLLAFVIGRGASSRLNLDLRDEQGLVHSIGAWSFTPGEPGLFGISATFDPEREQEVKAAIYEKIEKWRSDGFSDAEVAKARRNILVGALSDMQSMRGQVDSIASGEFYAGDPRFFETYARLINQVTPESLSQVLDRYIIRERQTTALLTPDSVVDEIYHPSELADTQVLMPQRQTLDNGIPLIVREDNRLPLTYVSVALLGGLLSEDEENQGISQFMSELLLRGTATRSARDIAEEVESMGASLSTFSGQNSFGIQGVSLADDSERLLEILVDSLINAAFPEREIERQRSRQLADIRAQRENPMEIAHSKVRAALYPNHPYSWTTAGAEETVSRFTREELREHLQRHLLSGNIAVSIFGNISPEDARVKVEKHFANIPKGDAMNYSFDLELPDLPKRVESREPRRQTIYMMAFPGISLMDERLAAMDLAQTALSGLSSRLGMEVREKRGLVYFVGAFQRPGLDAGHFALYAGTSEDEIPELERLMEEEIERIVSEGFDEDELARAVEQMAGRHYESLQDNLRLSQASALNELYGLGYDYPFLAEERIRSVTPEQVQQAAQEILDMQKRVVSIVFPVGEEY